MYRSNSFTCYSQKAALNDLPVVFLFEDKFPAALAQRCSVKKVFLEISQNSQENTCARASFLIKLKA